VSDAFGSVHRAHASVVGGCTAYSFLRRSAPQVRAGVDRESG
jgi:3-phosphoglycerate kinase